MQDTQTEWRCRRCGKLLGLIDNSRIHLRFARGHEYLVSAPVTATCRGCRALNEISSAPDKPLPRQQSAVA